MPNKNRDYKLSPLAETDLEEIWLYSFENWSLEQADKYQCDLVSVFKNLASGRYKGRMVDVRKGYLKYKSGSHFVYFRQSNSLIEVIRILHQMMDTGRHL